MTFTVSPLFSLQDPTRAWSVYGFVRELKLRHGSGNKGNFESGQNKIKACSYIPKDRQCDPLFVTMDTSCKLYFKRDNVSKLRTSNRFVDDQLPYPPLKHISYYLVFTFEPSRPDMHT